MVYQTGQQRIRYLVEFKTALDNDTETESIIEVTEDEQDSVESVDDQTADENNDGNNVFFTHTLTEYINVNYSDTI